MLKIALPGFTAALLALFAGDPSMSSDPSSVSVQKRAESIDRLVEADLRQAGVRPNRLTDDATFVRRTYLTLVGRIPTSEETRAFTKNRARDKRSRLIDDLLASPGHASRMFNWWADLLRVKTRLNRRISGEPFMHWIKQSVEDNKPYDRMVFEMLVAEGAAHKEGNGATGYYMRDRGMPEGNMANTVRVFLGTRLECAQCHNHPFDKWTQKQFFEMAAFTGGMQYSVAGRNQTAELRRVRNLMSEVRETHGERAVRGVQRTLIRPQLEGVRGTGTGLARLPKEYQYDDAAPRSIVVAHAIFGDSPEVKAKPVEPRRRRRANRRQGNNRRRGPRDNFPQLGSREQYAQWLTSSDNDLFKKVIANRMWKFAMGVGLIEPVDDIRQDTKPSNPELMAELEQLVVDAEFDLRQVLRVLLNTDAWQREAATEEYVPGQSFCFTGPLVNRMTAEQVWDSMLTLVMADPDATLGATDEKARAVYDRFSSIADMSDADLKETINRAALRYSNPEKFRQMQRQEREQRSREQRRKIRPLLAKLRQAQKRKDPTAVARIKGELKEMGVDPDRRRRPGRRRGAARRTELRRASALPQPAPNGHFLREFGQSDREQIQTSHTDASVPQVLSLMNGFVEDYVLAPASVVMSEVNGAVGVNGKIKAAYMAVLNRKPSGSELALWRNDLSRDVAQGTRDLVWTLVNTHEFRFVQ